MLTFFPTAAVEFLAEGEPKQRTWVERRARFVLGVRPGENIQRDTNDDPPRKRPRLDLPTPVSSPVKGNNVTITADIHTDPNEHTVVRTSPRTGRERTTSQEHGGEMHSQVHDSLTLINQSCTEMLQLHDRSDHQGRTKMHHDMAGETRMRGGDKCRREMRQIRIQNGTIHLASELDQTVRQQKGLGSTGGNILPEKTIRERDEGMPGGSKTTDNNTLHTLLPGNGSPVNTEPDPINLYCEETPYQSPAEIDFRLIRNRQLAYDQYDWLYEKCFADFRTWWSKNGERINKAYAIMDLHRDTISQLTIDSFKFARDYCLNHLYESESARKSLATLKQSGEIENCALDLQLNVAKLWADKEGGGGMRWCMKKCQEHADYFMGLDPLADAQQDETTNVDRA